MNLRTVKWASETKRNPENWKNCSSKCAYVCALEMSGNIFFNPIPSHSQWSIPIPIPNPMFSLVLFTFPLIIPIHSRSHSGTARSQSDNK